MRVVHVSWLKRSDGELGGVEKFAYYLERALAEAGHECLLIGWNDYPNRDRLASAPNPDKALLLGTWIEQTYDFDIAVSDGYWGAGITSHLVVPVVHGTWAQFFINMGMGAWTNPEVQAQHTAFGAVNARPVACSPASARELMAHHRMQPCATILHGVDLDVFRPRKFAHERPVVLHAATNDKKGKSLMPSISRLLPEFDVTFLAAAAGEEPERFQHGDIFFHPSRHEGNAYALLEALATGLPIVTTPVGLFEEPELGHFVWPLDSTVGQWANTIKTTWHGNYKQLAEMARARAREFADYETFAHEWRHFLGGLV